MSDLALHFNRLCVKFLSDIKHKKPENYQDH